MYGLRNTLRDGAGDGFAESGDRRARKHDRAGYALHGELIRRIGAIVGRRPHARVWQGDSRIGAGYGFTGFSDGLINFDTAAPADSSI